MVNDFKSISLIENGASSEIRRETPNPNISAISEWLKSKNIISNESKLISYKDISEWSRTGAETYCTSFSIEFQDNGFLYKKHINIKALISLPVEGSLMNWRRRRELLMSNDVSVSNWYFSGDGIIIEDYYPNVAEETTDFDELLRMARKLDELGFTGTGNFVRDVLCDKFGKPYLVDFGFDLGEPYNYGEANHAVQNLNEHFNLNFFGNL